jgi:hypothetical protein
LLGLFGPAGAIAGGLVGLGLLAYESFSGAGEAIKKVKEDAKELQKELNKATRVGTGDAFKNFAATATEQINNVKAKLSELSVPGKLEGLMNLIPGGGTLASAGMRDNRLAGEQKMQSELLGLQIKATAAANEMLDIEDKNLDVLKLRAAGRDKEADALENEIKMNAELGAMYQTNMAKFSSAYAQQQDDNIREKYALQEKIKLLKEEEKQREKTAAAVDELLKGIEEDEQRIAKRKKDREKKTEEDILEQIKKTQQDDAQLAAERIKREEDAKKEKEKIAQDQADKEAKIREQGANEFEAAEKRKQNILESRLSVEQKLQLSKERLAEAEKELKKVEGKPEEQAAIAKVGQAQADLMDAREAQIQRIMGGSTSAAAAQRAERKAVRDRARAERILDKREAIKAADAAARGEKRLPNRKGDAAVNLAAPPDKKDAQEQTTLLGKIEQEMKNLNNKLTVA